MCYCTNIVMNTIIEINWEFVVHTTWKTASGFCRIDSGLNVMSEEEMPDEFPRKVRGHGRRTMHGNRQGRGKRRMRGRGPKRGLGQGRGRRGRPRVVPEIETSWSEREESEETVELHLSEAEMEVIKLIDIENNTQEQAAQTLGVSRATIWRYLQSARKKIADALIIGTTIRVNIL